MQGFFEGQLRPRFTKIPAAVAYSGVGRSKLYKLAAKHPDLFRKYGKSTLVDIQVLDQILDALPAYRLGVA
jgi:hypothetical protein